MRATKQSKMKQVRYNGVSLLPAHCTFLLTRGLVMEPNDWTEVDLDDLKAAINDGLTVEEAAEVLGRSVEEVRAKCRELGLKPSGGAK